MTVALNPQGAVAAARRLSAQLGARLRIVGAIPEPSAKTRDALAKKLEEAASFARASDAEGRAVEVETSLRDGDPAEVLADEGIELDLLLIGSRGYGPIRRTMLGASAVG